MSILKVYYFILQPELNDFCNNINFSHNWRNWPDNLPKYVFIYTHMYIYTFMCILLFKCEYSYRLISLSTWPLFGCVVLGMSQAIRGKVVMKLTTSSILQFLLPWNCWEQYRIWKLGIWNLTLSVGRLVLWISVS